MARLSDADVDLVKAIARLDFYRQRYARLMAACRWLFTPWQPGQPNLNQVLGMISEHLEVEASTVGTSADAGARQRAETYKQQAIVNGQRRDMERVMRETAERERDAAVKARLDWQADYDREKAQWRAMLEESRQRAERAEWERGTWEECARTLTEQRNESHDTVAAERERAEGLRAALTAISQVPYTVDGHSDTLLDRCLEIADAALAAATTDDLPATTPRESHPVTLQVTDIVRGPSGE